jgi:cell division protein FtsW (lipid II flippase)
VLALNKYISDFTDAVCKQIKYKKIHQDISIEIQGHIHELMEEYIESGMNAEEAAQKATQQMGSPIEIGKKLNKTHKPKTEWSIILLIGALVLISGLVLISAIGDQTSLLSMNQFYKSYLVYTVIGIGICIAGYFIDITIIEKYSLHIFVATLVILFLSMWLPNRINGTHAIYFGHFTIMPVTILWPFFLVSFAGLLVKWVNGNVWNIIKLLGLALAAVLLCLMQPSFAVALLLGFGFMIMITIAIMNKNFVGNRRKFLLSIYGSWVAGISFVFIRITATGYQQARLAAFFNPKSDPLGAGYLGVLFQKVLSGAKFIGKGDYSNLSQGGSNNYFLTTNYVFTYIVSAFGWLAGLGLIFVIALTIIRIFLATKSIRFIYGKYIACSVVIVFTLQSMANILMNLGFFNYSDFPLPIISYGGANFISNMALIGLLLGVYRRKDIKLCESHQI